MDPEKLAAYLEHHCRPGAKTGRPIHRKTGSPITAVIPVHLYGQPAPMDPILELAEKHRLLVIEDACQAHGAEYLSHASPLTPHASPLTPHAWQKAGSLGLAAAFSFYPGQEPWSLRRSRRRHHQRSPNRRPHPEASGPRPGEEILSRHGRLQRAARRHHGRHPAGEAQAPRRVERRAAGSAPTATPALLADLDGVTIPFEAPYARSVYHLYVIRTRASRRAPKTPDGKPHRHRDSITPFPFISRKPIATGAIDQATTR